MPSHSDLPGNLSPAKFFAALARLGFRIDTAGGKGSHAKVTWENNKSVTIQKKLPRQVLSYILKEIEAISGITWEDIRAEL